MAKSNTGLYVGIGAVVVIVAAIIIGVVVANNNKDDDSGNKGTESSQTTNNSGGSSSNDASVIASELSDYDVFVEYGDYDAMEELSKMIQNGEMTGKVVMIDGLVAHPGTMYSIVQKNPAGSASIGTRFIINDSEDYPDDGEHVVLKGKIVEIEPMNFVIVTLDDFVDDVDGVDDIDDDDDD